MPLIDLDSFKDWFPLGDTSSADDALLVELIEEASAEIQRFCRRIFAQAPLTDEPHDGDGSCVLRLFRPPIASLTSLKVRVESTVVSTYTATDLRIVQHAEDAVDVNRGEIRFVSGARFPQGAQNILVSYTGGFQDVPAPVKQACREFVATLFLSRGKDLSVGVEAVGGSRVDRKDAGTMPAAVRRRLAPFRLPLPPGLQPNYESRRGAW